MQLVKFLLIKKWKRYFSFHNWLSLATVFFFFLSAMLYAYGASYLYNMAQLGKIKIAPASILNAIKYVIFFTPILFKFFPSFALKKTTISSHFPLNKKQILYTELALSFFKPLLFILTSFIIVFFAESNGLTSTEMICFLLLLFSGFLLAENFINAISWNKKFYVIILIVIVLLLFYFINSNTIKQFFLNELLLMANILLLIVYYFFYDTKFDTSLNEKDKKNKKYSISKFLLKDLYFKISIRKVSFRTTLVIAIAVKIFALTLLIPQSLHAKTEITFTNSPLFFLFLPPITLFTYIYNNTWGYFKSAVINLLIVGSLLKDYFNLFFRLFIYAFIIDFILSFSTLFIYKQFSYKILAGYFVLSFFAFTMGLLCSFIKFFEVKKAFLFGSFKSNTSQVFAFLVIVPPLAMFYFYNNDIYFYLYNIVVILLTLIFLGFIIKSNETLLSKLKHKLFTSNSIS